MGPNAGRCRITRKLCEQRRCPGIVAEGAFVILVVRFVVYYGYKKVMEMGIVYAKYPRNGAIKIKENRRRTPRRMRWDMPCFGTCCK